jgi:YidC/Oxa1 family membrane protein insertase
MTDLILSKWRYLKLRKYTPGACFTQFSAVLLLGLALAYPSVSRADVRLATDWFSVSIDSAGNESILKQDSKLSIEQRSIERRDDYSLQIKYRLANRSSEPLLLSSAPTLYVGQDFRRISDPGGGFGASFYSYLKPFVVQAGAAQIVATGDDPFTQPIAAQDWFGWMNRFNVDALQVNSGEWQLTGEQEDVAPIGLGLEMSNYQPSLAPGQSIDIQFRYLHAPKRAQVLELADVQLQRLLLPEMWPAFRALCFLLWDLADVLSRFTGSWGLAIVLLALIVRVVTIPITRLSLDAQALAREQQSRIAPLVQEVKSNYEGIEQSEKMIQLYEQENYNHLLPFKSMLGLFIQIPIFIALFNVLGDIWELSGQSFLWIDDLARSDRLFSWGADLPYFGSYFNLLPFLMAVVTVLSTWVASRKAEADSNSSLALFGMAGVFFFLFYSFPAALVLYWTSSNFFQLLQQFITDKK